MIAAAEVSTAFEQSIRAECSRRGIRVDHISPAERATRPAIALTTCCKRTWAPVCQVMIAANARKSVNPRDIPGRRVGVPLRPEDRLWPTIQAFGHQSPGLQKGRVGSLPAPGSGGVFFEEYAPSQLEIRTPPMRKPPQILTKGRTAVPTTVRARNGDTCGIGHAEGSTRPTSTRC